MEKSKCNFLSFCLQIFTSSTAKTATVTATIIVIVSMLKMLLLLLLIAFQQVKSIAIITSGSTPIKHSYYYSLYLLLLSSIATLANQSLIYLSH